MNRLVLPLKTDFRFQKFSIEESLPEGVFSPDFDDSGWKTLRIPHDWGIEGDFNVNNDPCKGTIIEDGQRKPGLHTGRTGGLPIVGKGVYRKRVEIPQSDHVFLELDGVMWKSEVWCNGRKMGGYHFGYGSYEVDLTEAVEFGKENLIAVYAEVGPHAGRWYTGGGLYRNLRLVCKDREHISYNGVWIRQRYADRFRAIMDLSVESTGSDSFTAEITDPNGKTDVYPSSGDHLLFEVRDPLLWDVETPQLYTAKISLPSGDSQTVRFGIRICEFKKEGFFLNGRRLKLNGVCMHHDQGMLGAAVTPAALRRRIEIMKGMGVNAWRTSHNPPAPELLDLCDEMGILVMDEFFDEWELPKVKNGYAANFRDHATEDLTAVVRRDRNHPSVIMWSIGNELREQLAEGGGAEPARRLYDACHAADPTRPVTAGLNRFPESNGGENVEMNKVQFFCDIVGLNYKPHCYKMLREQYPEMLLLGAETESCISSRGIYHFPAEIFIDSEKIKVPDLTVSAYELKATAWSYYPEHELAAQKDCPFVMGEFIWTGFDYMGEPTPYYEEWPSRSSYFGVVDLAGLPKNRYYCYRSAWTEIPTLHIFPHWTWDGKEGECVPVHIYTNYEEVELFVNGVSQGKRRHAKAEECAEVLDKYEGSHLKRFRLMWNDVTFRPGEITAVAYQNGKETERKTVRTAGTPYKIKLSAYKPTLIADGEDVNFITASILDRNGNLCPHASNRLTFKVEGAATLHGTDAGDQRETETFLRPDKKAFSGLLVACIRATETPGQITVTCSGEGLCSDTIILNVQ